MHVFIIYSEMCGTDIYQWYSREMIEWFR